MSEINFVRMYSRRRDRRRIEKLEAEVASLRWRLHDMERDVFEARAESLGENIWAMGVNQLHLRNRELEAEVERLRVQIAEGGDV